MYTLVGLSCMLYVFCCISAERSHCGHHKKRSSQKTHTWSETNDSLNMSSLNADSNDGNNTSKVDIMLQSGLMSIQNEFPTLNSAFIQNCNRKGLHHIYVESGFQVHIAFCPEEFTESSAKETVESILAQSVQWSQVPRDRFTYASSHSLAPVVQ